VWYFAHLKEAVQHKLSPEVEKTTRCGCECHGLQSDRPLATRNDLRFGPGARQLPVYRCDECYRIWERATTQHFIDFIEGGT
jgi:hypothetical protein